VRKIISILVALGLILAMSAVATPVSAAVSGVSVSLTNYCACAAAGYNVTFNISADLHSGTHSVSIEFPAGTTVPASFATGKIKIGGNPVFGTEVTVDGTKVTFLVPVDIIAPGAVTVEFAADAGLKNPCDDGPYKVKVNTSRAPDSTPVESAAYTIQPATETFEFEYDFGPTYPGIAKDFVPPFKACGQNDTTGQGFNTIFDAGIGGFLSGFNLTFMTDDIGCKLPCNNVSLWFELTACPAGETITLNLTSTRWTLTAANVTTTVGKYDSAKDVKFDPVLVLSSNMTEDYEFFVHFSSPGSYQICFYAECPAVTGCDPAASSIIADTCLDFEVYQWKEAFKIPLYAKWNLISLPYKPFDSDIVEMLKSFPSADKIMAIWHYDQCADDWFGYPGHGLTDMVDGDGYWIRLPYSATKPVGSSYGGWWVWGTDRPYEEAPVPFNYEECESWSMIGYTAVSNNMSRSDKSYLWNWWDVPGTFADYGLIYGWNAATQAWAPQTPGGATLAAGNGYWISFERDGWINP
jgi:hypothetical protein